MFALLMAAAAVTAQPESPVRLAAVIEASKTICYDNSDAVVQAFGPLNGWSDGEVHVLKALCDSYRDGRHTGFAEGVLVGRSQTDAERAAMDAAPKSKSMSQFLGDMQALTPRR
jgi:hypothetical protein